jgi:hypothetical protein
MVAAFYGSVEVVRFLLSAGCEVNARSPDDGYTALHCAASGGYAKSVEAITLLLRAGADRDIPDVNSLRPVQVIRCGSGPPGSKEMSDEDMMTHTLLERLLEVDSPPRSPTSTSALEAKQHATDEFRMYDFKVRACPKQKSHDWTDCPFAHPGEKATRRDPRRYAYTGIACPEFRKGVCRRGSNLSIFHVHT